jgi:hypothetical protein
MSDLPASAWYNAALAKRVWDRSPALAWLLDVPPPALFCQAQEQRKHLQERQETRDGRDPD